MNLLLDDSDDEFEVEEDDDDEEEVEEATDTSPHLSDSSDNDPDGGQVDTRSEEDSDPDGAPLDNRSEEGTSELWESAQRIEVTDSDQISEISDGPEEGTNEAVQSGSEGTNEAVQSRSAAELETALTRTDENQPSSNTPDDGPIPRKVDPSDTTQETSSGAVSMTRPRLPLDGVDPEPDPEVREPSYRPSLHCMRELLSFAENQSQAQQEEARRVLKYLLSMEDPRRRHQDADLERRCGGGDAERRRPTGRAQDQQQAGNGGGAERRRPTRRAQTGRDETECRRSSPDRETRGVSRREDRDEIRIRSGPRGDRPPRLHGFKVSTDSGPNCQEGRTGAELAAQQQAGGGWCVAGRPPRIQWITVSSVYAASEPGAQNRGGAGHRSPAKDGTGHERACAVATAGGREVRAPAGFWQPWPSTSEADRLSSCFVWALRAQRANGACAAREAQTGGTEERAARVPPR